MKNNKKFAIFTMDIEGLADTGCLVSRGIRPDYETFDGIGEYLGLLQSHGIKATLFTLKSSAEELRDKLLEYSREGHEIALHGYDHTPLNRMEKEEFLWRTKEAKEYLEELLSKRIRGFRAPYFSMDTQKLAVLRELGFEYDSSSHAFTKNYLKKSLIDGSFDVSDYTPIMSGAYKKEGFFEYGLSCQNILGCSYPVSGGGYVRLCPWFIVKGALRRYIRKNDLYVFYLHPFELSRKSCGRIKGLPKRDNYYLKGGISKFGKKIEKIIGMLKSEGYEFVTFEELCKLKEKESAEPSTLGTKH